MMISGYFTQFNYSVSPPTYSYATRNLRRTLGLESASIIEEAGNRPQRIHDYVVTLLLYTHLL